MRSGRDYLDLATPFPVSRHLGYLRRALLPPPVPFSSSLILRVATAVLTHATMGRAVWRSGGAGQQRRLFVQSGSWAWAYGGGDGRTTRSDDVVSSFPDDSCGNRQVVRACVVVVLFLFSLFFSGCVWIFCGLEAFPSRSRHFFRGPGIPSLFLMPGGVSRTYRAGDNHL
jgi:hypothetical protein